MQEVLAFMTSKSAAWLILSSALSTLVVTITCIVIAKSRKSVLEAVFTQVRRPLSVGNSGRYDGGDTRQR